MLDIATSLLFKQGYKTPSAKLSGQWGIGHKALADACSRLEYPDLYGVGSQELLVIPTSFVGLESNPTLTDPEISLVAENIYCLSANLLAISIIRVHIRSGSSFSIKYLMDAWASYFYAYCGFHIDSLNDAEQNVQDEWRRIGSEMGFGQASGLATRGHETQHRGNQPC
jgi:hypothetical protein